MVVKSQTMEQVGSRSEMFVQTNTLERNDMHIIAYTYVADHHCIDCTVEKFHYSKQTWINWDFNMPHPASDENGIHVAQEDSEGNLVHPIFSTDEWYDKDMPSVFADGTCDHYWDWQCVCSDTQYLACGDCHKMIEEYTVEGDAYVNSSDV